VATSSSQGEKRNISEGPLTREEDLKNEEASIEFKGGEEENLKTERNNEEDPLDQKGGELKTTRWCQISQEDSR